jgi:hypothetical protein
MDKYYEIQKFNKWYIRLILFIPVLIFIFGIASGKIEGEEKTPMIISVVVVAFMFVLFQFTNLETRIDESGITIRFFPFQRRYYYVRWDEISQASVRTYKPIREYGGWGLRYSIKHGKAYNVSGNKGLQLTLLSGKKFLIGTQKADELQSFLKELKESKQILCIQI